MSCIICRGVSNDIPFGNSGKTFDCSSCGPFSISGAAIQQMNIHIRLFNRTRVMDWLSDQRQSGLGIPVIEVSTPVWD